MDNNEADSLKDEDKGVFETAFLVLPKTVASISETFARLKEINQNIHIEINSEGTLEVEKG